MISPQLKVTEIPSGFIPSGYVKGEQHRMKSMHWISLLVSSYVCRDNLSTGINSGFPYDDNIGIGKPPEPYQGGRVRLIIIKGLEFINISPTFNNGFDVAFIEICI